MLRLTIATLLGLSGAVVSVPALPVHAATPASIVVTPANSCLGAGLDRQFTATGTYADGTTVDLTLTSSWSSSVVAVATINSTGLAHAVSPGPTTITASNSSVTGSTGLTVLTCPTITTVATSSFVGGPAITDTATLSGGVSPTGTIRISVFSSSDCSSLLAPSDFTITGNGSFKAFYPAVIGTYWWMATYGGDANNATVSTLCGDSQETSVVTLLPPPTTITTSGATPSVNFGDKIFDTATLSGGNSPGGTINFMVYASTDTTCTNPLFTSPVAVSGDGTYLSGPVVTKLPGTFHWVANYLGDPNNNSAISPCLDAGEISIVKARPTITTAATSGTAGGTISDTATLGDAVSPTGGSITFSAFGPNNANCTVPAAFTATNPVGNGNVTSASFTPVAAGTYHWVAVYNGDPNNNTAASLCTDSTEISNVTPASPTITTRATSAIAGGTISDTATLALGVSPTGTITFSAYGPNNANCTVPAAFTATNPVGNGNVTSASFTPVAAGTYHWVAVYNGDPNNNTAASLCADTTEISNVDKANPTIGTAATSTTVGGTISDTATLALGVNPTGTITFSAYGPNNANCTVPAAFTATNPVGNGNVTSASFTPVAAGTYHWVAVYNGDPNNNTAASLCADTTEISNVDKANPTIGTAATSATLGGTISDTATLALGVSPTGTITFSAYGPNNANCTVPAAFTATNPVGNGNVTSASFTPVAPGTYLWVAAYSGDGNNNGITSACNAPGETSTVTPAANSQDVNLQMFRVGRFSSGHLGVFIVLISNTGTVDTSGTLTFTDTLPAGLTFVDSFSFGWNCSVAGQTVTCTFDNSLPVGGFTGLVLIVDVTAPRDIVLTSTGTVTPLDATPDDNTASVTVTVSGGQHEWFWEGNTDQNDEATLDE